MSGRPQIDFVCFTVYDRSFPLPVAFAPRDHKNVLAEVWEKICVRNYRLAETEKYAHVTYFFNGGVEKEHACERRLLVPSPKIATYDLQPEMSAFKVTDKVLRGIEEAETDIFIVNFANPDMVGHTGKLDKTIEACQYVDTCLGWITKGIRQARGVTIITADHGNAEQMIDPQSGGPHTAHTTNPVPFHLIDEASRGLKLREGGALEDVAPTLLGLLGNEKPEEMTGRDLRDDWETIGAKELPPNSSRSLLNSFTGTGRLTEEVGRFRVFDPRNILVIDFGQLGDVVLSLPALGAIRKRFPRARITVAVGKPGAEVVALSGFADETLVVDRVALRDGFKPLSVFRVFKIVKDVREKKFDFVIDLHSLSETNLLGFSIRRSKAALFAPARTLSGLSGKLSPASASRNGSSQATSDRSLSRCADPARD